MGSEKYIFLNRIFLWQNKINKYNMWVDNFEGSLFKNKTACLIFHGGIEYD